MKKTASTRWVYFTGLLMVAVAGRVCSQDLDFTFGPSMNRYPTAYRSFFNTSLQREYHVNLYKKFTVTPVDKYINLPGPAIPVKTEIFADKDYTEVQGFYTNQEKNFLIYSLFDWERKSLTLYEQELSVEMALLGSPARMAEFNDIKPFHGRLRSYPEAVSIAKSRSQQQIVFVKKRDSLRLEIKGASPGKGELWSKVFQLDRAFKSFWVNTIEVAENGTVYILGSYYKPKCFFCKPGWLEIPFLLAYSPASKAYALHALKFGDQQSMGCMLKLMDNDIPVVAGPCSKGPGDYGYCIYKVNPGTLEVEMFASQPIAKSYKVAFNEVTLPLKDIAVGDMVQTESENIVLTIQASGQYPVNEAYLYNFSIPIYVASIDQHGVEKWNTTIERHDATSSYNLRHVLFYKGDKTYVLYNDNIAGFDLAPTEKQREKWLTKKTYAAAAEIDETGKARKLHLLSSDKKQRTSLLFDRSKAIDDHLFHFLFDIDGSYRLATLRVNE